MVKIYDVYEWLNREKARFYKITIHKYDFDVIKLCYRWGGCNSNRGGNKSILVRSEEEVNQYISVMMKRRKSRGYELVAPMICC